jgi:hypothetical protein
MWSDNINDKTSGGLDFYSFLQSNPKVYYPNNNILTMNPNRNWDWRAYFELEVVKRKAAHLDGIKELGRIIAFLIVRNCMVYIKDLPIWSQNFNVRRWIRWYIWSLLAKSEWIGLYWEKTKLSWYGIKYLCEKVTVNTESQFYTAISAKVTISLSRIILPGKFILLALRIYVAMK